MSDRHRRGTQQRRSGTSSSGSQRYVLPATTYDPSRTYAGSGSQEYVLPATTYDPSRTYAGSGGGRDSGGSQIASSSGASARVRLYDQYGRDHRSTPSRRGSQQSDYHPGDYPEPERNSVSTVLTRASRVVPVGGQGSTHSSQQNDNFQAWFLPSSTGSSLGIVNSGTSGSGSGHPHPGSGSGNPYSGSGSGRPPSSAGSRHGSMTSQRQRAANTSLGNSASFAVQVGTGADPALTTFGEGSRSHELWLRRRQEEEARAAAAGNPPPPRRNPVKTFFQKSREEIDRRLHRKKK